MKRKKVYIITLNGYFNYGNRLQNYALTKTLEGYGFDTRTIWHKTNKTKFKNLIKACLFFTKQYRAYSKIYMFSKMNINEINNPTARRDPDYYVVGSDQVWNPSLITKDRTWFYSTKTNTISYAASFGTELLSEKYLKKISEMTSNYKYISVREESAKKSLEKYITNKRIYKVLDPTLLLNQNHWSSLCKRPILYGPNGKYILCYILGDTNNVKIIKDFAKKQNKKIILFSDKKDSIYGISEFLYLIKNADLVFTDSFHASVFSIIFERPFIVFERTGNMNYTFTRIKDLIKTLKIEDREFNGKEITKENLEVDYTEAKEILKREQKKSLDFLKKALDVKK